MELEQMKALWAQQEQPGTAIGITDGSSLQQTIKKGAKHSLTRLSQTEYFVVGFNVVMLVLLLYVFPSGRHDWLYKTGYFIALAYTITCIGVSWYKLRLLSGIKISSGNVADVLRKINLFRLIIVRERSISIILLPLLLFAFLPIVYQWVYGAGILNKVQGYIPHLVIGSIVGILMSIVAYKRFYMNRIEAIREQLRETETFTAV